MIRPTIFTEPLPVPVPIALVNGVTRTVHLRQRSFKVHNSLPASNFWTYEDQTIPANATPATSYINLMYDVPVNAKVTIDWQNDLFPSGLQTFPPTHFHIPFPIVENAGDFEQNRPVPFNATNYKAIEANTVVHLHGAKVAADSDGWTDNMTMPSQTQHCVYENHQLASMLWFHDHAMMNTRYNVFAGLAGAWALRNLAIENTQLHLPANADELVLVIQDRNLEQNAGIFTGKIAHITEANTMEFFGPYNLVNGKINPFKNVDRKNYRIRIINGSNARVLNLVFVDKSSATASNPNPIVSIAGFVKQIGTDGGLLNAPKPIVFSKSFTNKTENIVLAPGERGDYIIDFTALANKDIVLFNIAAAPYDGSTVCNLDNYPLAGFNNDADPLLIVGNEFYDNKNIFPEVMKFHVSNTVIANPPDLTKLALFNNFGGMATTNPANVINRYVVLSEKMPESMNHMGGNPMLILSELVEIVATATTTVSDEVAEMRDHFKKRIITIKNHLGIDRFFYIVGEMMHETHSIMAKLNTVEVWNVINLTKDTHPFHIHLVQFQMLNNRKILSSFASNAYNTCTAITTPMNNIPVVNYDLGAVGADVDTIMTDADNAHINYELTFATPSSFLVETGWKDTARINPGEMVSLAMRYEGYCGKYMYHCHLLEHEDMEMMRPFVVTPPTLRHGWIIDRFPPILIPKKLPTFPPVRKRRS